MTGTVTLYAQTHFNGIDIPSEPSVLERAQVVTILNNVYYTRMDVDLTFIDLDIQYSGVRDVDYVKIHDNQDNMNYYYRAIPAAMAKGTTRLALKLDALLTLGGAKHCEYLSGWQERGHIPKAEDTLFSNIASESWVPSRPLENSDMVSVTGLGDYQSVPAKGLNVCVSNVDLTTMGQYTDKVEALMGVDPTDPNFDPKMYLPSLKAAPYNTNFIIYDHAQQQSHDFNLPSTAAYNMDNATIKAGIENLYSCGQLSLQASYNIPKEYVGAFSNRNNNAGEIQSILGYHGSQAISSLPYEYTQGGYTVKNKKCFATFRAYNIVSLASGDVSCKEPEKLYRSGDTYPSVLVWADPCSTGKPYARFSYIKTSPNNLWTDCVRGLQWSNSQIVIEGASGSLWNSIDMAFSNQQITRNKESILFNNQINSSLNAVAMDQASLDYDRNSISNSVGMGGAGVDAAGAVVDAYTFSNGKGASYTIEKDNPLKSLKNYQNAIDENKNSSMQASNNLASAIYNGISKLGTGAYDQIYANPKQFEYTKQRLNLQQSLIDYSGTFASTDAAIALNKNGLDLYRQNNVVAPNVSFMPEQNYGLYGYNSFVVYETKKSLEDLKSEDNYYQRYGYSGLHRPLTVDAFKARTHYNFVQAFDINLKGLYSLGARVEAAAILQLNGGVRVWNELPNTQAYETN